MKVTLLQRDIVWAKPATNLQRLEERLAGFQDSTDLLVLPEMFSTGFVTTREDIDESNDCRALEWMMKTAAARNAAVAGSLVVRENDKVFNRFYFVEPDGQVSFYDKHHLFTYGHEHECYMAGDRRVVVDYRSVRILLLTCYDLRFPVWSRNRGDYDMIIYVANWPEGRIDVWDTLLRARALENQCYVVGVNRTGTSPVVNYNGHSVLLDPYGKTVAGCGEQECEATGELDLNRLRLFREKFPVLRDADNFHMI